MPTACTVPYSRREFFHDGSELRALGRLPLQTDNREC